MASKPDTKLRELFGHVRQVVNLLEDIVPQLSTAISPSTSAEIQPPKEAFSKYAPLDKLAYSIKDVCQLTSLSRSMLYTEISEGRLRAVKRGNRTLILAVDLREWITRWPASR